MADTLAALTAWVHEQACVMPSMPHPDPDAAKCADIVRHVRAPSDPAAPLRDALKAIEALPKWDKRSVPGGFHVNRADVLTILRAALTPAPKEADR